MSTNPFDDDLPPSHPPPIGGGRSTNPFSDDDDDDRNAGIGAANNNPTSASIGQGIVGVGRDHPNSATTTVLPPSSQPPLNSGYISRSSFVAAGGGEDGNNDASSSSMAFGGPQTSSSTSTSANTGESSWQDLGDLPYRRVRLFSDVRWGRKREKKRVEEEEREGEGSDPSHGGTTTAKTKTTMMERDSGEVRIGLAWYPDSYVETVRSHQNGVLGGGKGGDERQLARLLSTTTTTFVAGCANGGPIAAMTVPLLSAHGGGAAAAAASGFGNRSTLRIMNNTGTVLSSVSFPPRDLAPQATSGDVLAVGFTSRCVLVIALRDSLVLCYDLAGNPVLPPFYALPRGSNGKGGGGGGGGGTGGGGTDLLEARVFEGGVAVLGADANAAVVELLDEHDDPRYADGADVACRRIAYNNASSSSSPSPSSGADEDPSSAAATTGNNVATGAAPPPHHALVTPLPTGMFARSRGLTFRCIAVLPRQYAPSGRPELFLSTSDGSVVVGEMNPSTSPDNGFTDVDCRSRIGGGADSPIVSMSFAPNGRFLACFTSDSVLTVVSTNFESKVLEFDARSGSSSPPRSMGWCGEDSVVLHWKSLGVLMVGPYGDWLRFPCDDEANGSGGGGGGDSGTEVYLVPEIDCCRVVSPSSVEILQRVPPVVADLLRIGSIEPGALLLDASDAFDSGGSNADEAARAIARRDGLLEEAILGCVEAAAGEFDVGVQKRMLRAASYGLHFACREAEEERQRGGSGSSSSSPAASGRPSPEARTFVEVSRKLRVLNALRRPATGFATTSSQYDAVMPRGVVARLVAAGRASLAASVAEYLKLGRGVGDYARAMKAAAFVSSFSSTSSSSPRTRRDTSMTDTQIAEEAIRIVRGQEKGSSAKPQLRAKDESSSAAPPPSSGMYASVALAAHRAGRKGVADLLIMLEQSPTDKVRALLAIGSYADAAAVACRARDPDLIHATMSAYERGLSNNEEGKSLYFSGVINKYPMEAVNMFTAFYSRFGELRGGDARPSVNILLRRQKHAEAGLRMAKKALALRPAASASGGDDGREKDKLAALQEASNIFDLGGKDCAFQKTCTDEQISLVADQEQLRRSYGSAEVAPPSSSLTSTIMSVVKHGAVDPLSSHRLQADADRLAKKYRVPEKRQWHVKVRALSESGQWAQLRNLLDSRAKPPIGIKPFALAAIRGGQGQVEIMHYISRMADKSDWEDRYDLFCEAGMWKKALEESVRLGDGRKIAHVKSMCNSPDIQRLCDKYV